MGRDSRGDRYARRGDIVSDRHGVAESSGSASKNSTRYGRYAGKRRSRSPQSGRRGASEERDSDRYRGRRRSNSEEQRRRRHGTGRGRSGSKEVTKKGRGRRRSRSLESSSSTSSMSRRGGGGRKRFEAVDMRELLQPETPTAAGGTAAPLPAEMIMALIQQQQQQMLFQHQDAVTSVRDVVMPTPDPTAAPEPAPVVPAAPANVDTTNEAQQYQQQPQQGGEKREANEESVSRPEVPSRVLPSVADFVPVIPKSLLSLLSAPGAANNDGSSHGGGGGGGGLPGANAGGEAEDGQQGALMTTTGALAVLQAPKLSPEAERRAREARRAHISCFPQGTTRQELLDYFTTIIPMVRRVKVQKEMDRFTEILREEGGPKADIERREIPPDAIVDVDHVIDLAVNSAKSKPFAFLEVNLADLVTELVEESQRDPERFTFIAADGQSYPITIRRPRDYQALAGVDNRKVVMLGFPSTLSMQKLRMAFEEFGPLLAFDVKAGMAYGEFEKESDAIDFVGDLHGQTLGTNVVVLMPLYDWLKVVCTHADIDVALDPDDPVSGASLLAKDGQVAGALVPVLAEDVERTEEPVNHMKELVEFAVQLPDVVLHFAKTFPHLATLYGSTVPIYPTRVLVLLNLFDEEELVLDDTYERLVDEISGEVEKYGRVKTLIVPRRAPPPIPPKPPKNYFGSRINMSKKSGGGGGRDRRQKLSQGAGGASSAALYVPRDGAPPLKTENEEGGALGRNDFDMDYVDEEAQYEQAKVEYLRAREEYTERLVHPIHGGFGRVFVEYESVDEAAEAQRAIAGRLFGGRTIVTSFMFEDVLHPPTAEEMEVEADKKLQLYLESMGAGSDDGEAQPEEVTAANDTVDDRETAQVGNGIGEVEASS
ncbi:U2AF65-like splicing factor [Trypanosoma rangeli]|uniref:U2AF65-like splicing factor n=1 Tax=Trypanosoma rangeli TaxID=5698 RepID=A0A3R7MIS4_TRYRA|nr:U2AF65-like splicing factor [Trypanosoma rangeli]RNF06688.1 U2AF65-like splicing factor [Trypanosoma rangeli]|eukprot:RNF06688.1 U2AF65-like splicing factor [Trypanosoma rangeli]